MIVLRKIPVDSDFELAALLTGTLCVIDNVLKIVSHDSDAIYTPIWNTNTVVSVTETTVLVFSTLENIVVCEGETITVGGGEFTEKYRDWLSGLVVGGIPDKCSGPYWSVGRMVRNV